MSPVDTSCTAPQRWPAPPRADAPDTEVLDYLRHVETCPYHRAYERRRDLPLDVLLTEACQDLPVGPVPVVGRRDRAARPAPRRRVVPHLAGALAAAAVVVALYVGLPRLLSPPVATPDLAAVAPPLRPEAPMTGLAVEAGRRLMWYKGRVIADERHGRYTGSGVRYDREALTAAIAQLAFGSRLRLINPVNGRSVEVRVIDRGAEPGALHLSAAAADSLAFDGLAMLLVEVLEVPRTAIGP